MKKILITGGTSGIGLELVKYFDKGDYQVYFTARNPQKAEKLIREHQLKAQACLVDFSSFKSIIDFTNRFKEAHGTLDILINNAGTWQMEFHESQDGIEMNFAVNHLSPMLLTLELLPILKAAPTARVISTSSGAHRRNILNFDDLEFRKTEYSGTLTYSQSKIANILFSLHLSRILSDSSVSVNTVHPGYVKTELFENMRDRNWNGVPSAFEGARSAIYAAESADVEGVSGQYYFKEAVETRISPLAQDPVAAEKLWAASLTYLTPFLSQP